MTSNWLARRFENPQRRNAWERAFLPAALEIVETPPSPTWRGTALIIVGFLAAALSSALSSRKSKRAPISRPWKRMREEP